MTQMQNNRGEALTALLWTWDLGFASDFGFRISDFMARDISGLTISP